MSQSTRFSSTARNPAAAAIERLRSAFAPVSAPRTIRKPAQPIGPRRPASEVLRDAAVRAARIATIDLDREPWWLYFRKRK